MEKGTILRSKRWATGASACIAQNIGGGRGGIRQREPFFVGPRDSGVILAEFRCGPRPPATVDVTAAYDLQHAKALLIPSNLHTETPSRRESGCNRCTRLRANIHAYSWKPRSSPQHRPQKRSTISPQTQNNFRTVGAGSIPLLYRQQQNAERVQFRPTTCRDIPDPGGLWCTRKQHGK